MIFLTGPMTLMNPSNQVYLRTTTQWGILLLLVLSSCTSQLCVFHRGISNKVASCGVITEYLLPSHLWSSVCSLQSEGSICFNSTWKMRHLQILFNPDVDHVVGWLPKDTAVCLIGTLIVLYYMLIRH
jgi:hypothetical protein